MTRRMNALRVIAKYGLTPVDRVARAGVNYETSNSHRNKGKSVSTRKAISPPLIRPPKIWVKCSVCSCSLLEGRLNKHMKRVHSEQRLENQKPHTKEEQLNLGKYTNCSICGCLLKVTRESNHMRKTHKVSV